jgi:hypothetical protein
MNQMMRRAKANKKTYLRLVSPVAKSRKQLSIMERLEVFQDELMSAAENGQVIMDMREIAAEIATVIRIELLRIAVRRSHARDPSPATGSAVRKFAASFATPEQRDDGDAAGHGAGSADDDADESAADDESTWPAAS